MKLGRLFAGTGAALAALAFASAAHSQTNVGGTISTNATWSLAGSPYTVTSTVTVSNGAILTIDPGVTVKVNLNLGVTISNGLIRAMGTAASPILFTAGAQPVTAGYWRSLTISSSATTGSELHYVRIEGGGRGSTASLIATSPGLQMDHVTVASRAFTGVQLASNAVLSASSVESGPGIGVSVAGGNPTIDGCTIAASPSFRGVSVLATTTGVQLTNSSIENGLEMTQADNAAVTTGNTFTNYSSGPGIRLHPQLVSRVLGGGTIQGAVAGNTISVLASAITSTATWPKFAYLLEGTVTASTGATGSWTIAAGAELRLPTNAAITVSTGALRVMGAIADPVLFTSSAATKAAGDWRAVTLSSGAQPSEIHFARIEYAGRSPDASLVVDVSSAVIEGVTIASRGWIGIQLVSTNATVTSSSVEAGSQVGITISGGAPVIDTCAVAGSATVRGIQVVSATSGLQIVNSSIQDGLEIPATDAGLLVSGNTFVDYPTGPGLRLNPVHVAPVLANNTLQNAVAGVSSLAVTAGTLGASAAWPKFVYVLEGSLTAAPGASGVWTIAAGAQFRVAANGTVTMSSGSLHAMGTGIDPILFTSNTPSPVAGTWRQLILSASAQPSELHFVRVEGAGAAGFPSLDFDTDGVAEGISVGYRANVGVRISGASGDFVNGLVEAGPAIGLSIVGGSPVIDSWTIAASPTARGVVVSGATAGLHIVNSTIQHGLEIQNADNSLLVSGNTFVDYPGGLGFRLYPQHLGQVFANNTVQGLVLGSSSVAVTGGSIITDTTWPKLVYNLEGTVSTVASSTTSWTLVAGTQMRIAAGVSVQINGGSLHAMGTPSERVVFSSDVQPAVAGRWRQLSLAGGIPSELHYVRIEGGGYQTTASLVVSSDSALDHISVGVRAGLGVQLSGVDGTLPGGVVEAGPGVGVQLSGGTNVLDGWDISATSPALGITVASSNTVIRNSTITGGIQDTATTFELRSSTVRQSAGIGLECSSTSGVARITDSQFQNNAATGITCARAVEIARNTITGSPVGIRLTRVDPKLRLRNNNLAGLATPLQNQDAANGVDARLNWWGTTGNPASLISGAALSNPWLGAAYSGPFAVQDALATPTSFVPATNSTTFSGMFSDTGSWTLALSDPNQVVVRSFSGSAATLSQPWSGDDPNGVTLPNATYSYALNVTGASGSAAPVLGEVTLNAALVSVKLTSPTALQYIVGGAIPVQGVVSGAGLTSYTLSYAVGAAPLDGAFTTVASGTTPVSGAIATWQTSGLNQGVYTLRLQANAGAPSQARDDAELRILITSSITTTPYFSPNGDGTLDQSLFSANLTLDIPWVLDCLAPGGQIVREFTGSTTDADATWDGRDGGGALQPDASYTFRLTTPVAPSLPPLASTTTVLDDTAPVAQIDQPLDGLVLLDYSGVPFVGTATDANLQRRLLQISPTSNPSSVTTISSAINPIVSGTLGTLDVGDGVTPAFANGSYVAKLDVQDKAGNHAIVTRGLSIDQLHIGSLTSTPEVIDPTIGQMFTIGYAIDRPANVSVRVYQSVTHALTRTLLAGDPETAGTYSLSWDGLNASSSFAPPGGYYFSIQASDSLGHSVTYNDPSAPTMGTTAGWQNAKINGLPATQLASVQWSPYRNDPLVVEFDDTQPVRETIQVNTAAPQAAAIPLLSLATPVPSGHTTVSWDGRMPNGKIYSTNFSVFFGVPAPVEIHPMFLRYGGTFGDVRTNPYLFHPTLAEVTNLKYSLALAAHVAVDVVDPNGNFLMSLLPSTAEPAGDYEIFWDGHNPAGDIVTTAGSYTLQLTGVDDASGQPFSRRATVLVAP